MKTDDFPPNPLEKAGYRLEFHDEFDSGKLDTDKWIPYYLPQWSSREKSKPRYTFRDNQLVLQIEADQQPWCPEFNGEVIVSSLQTGLYAGQVGSQLGQHHFSDALIVRETQTTQRTYTPQYGYFEARVKALKMRGSLGTLWMIGFEEVPEESGEIAVFELFGDYIGSTESEVRYGVHPFDDPNLTDEFYKDIVPIDASHFHIYAVEWTPTHIDFYVDNVKRRTITQSPNYPLQLMLGTYELPGDDTDRSTYPKQFIVDYVRVYQPISGYES